MKYAAVLLLTVLFSAPPLCAAETTVEAGASYSFVFSPAVMEFDRTRWLSNAQLIYPVSGSVSVGAGYSAGGILY
jgi:hypothetical protein